MKSRIVKWSLLTAVLLLLLWWLMRRFGSGSQPTPAGNDLSLSNTEPAIPLPLSNVPQGNLGPPTQQEQEQTQAEETPAPETPAPLFPLKENQSPIASTQAPKKHKHTPKTPAPQTLAMAPAVIPSVPVPAAPSTIPVEAPPTPASASAPPAPTVATKVPSLNHTKGLSSEEKHLIRLTLVAQPPLAAPIMNLLKTNPKRAALAATHFIALSPADKHQIGLALKAQPALANRLTNILVVDGHRTVVGAAHFNGLPAKDKKQIDQTFKAEPALTENLAKLILEPSRSPEIASASNAAHYTGKRFGRLDHEMEWWGYRSGVTKEQTILIKDDETWDKFRSGFPMPPGWTPEKDALDPRLRRAPPVLPEIDFDKMMVVGVFLGKVQEGYRIAISTMTLTADRKTMNVDYGKTFPLPNPMAGTALNEPYDIMVIKRYDGDVYFWNKP